MSLCRYVASVNQALHTGIEIIRVRVTTYDSYCAQATGYEVCDIAYISANASPHLQHYNYHKG